MIIDGKTIADEIIADLFVERQTLQNDIHLGVLMGAGDPASASFVRIKEQVAKYLRVSLVREMVSDETTTDVATHTIQWVFKDMQGIIVQLPLPVSLDIDKVLAAIPPNLDVDGVNPTVLDIDRAVRAPVASALAEILSRTGVVVREQKATVVGAGRLVGLPCAALLRQMGAQVTVVTAGQSLESLKEADIAVLGAGTPGLIQPDMLKKGVLLFDAGTSDLPAQAGQKARIGGDADPACAEVAGIFTPVPGGVGPIAVAMIFKNLFTLIQSKRS